MCRAKYLLTCVHTYNFIYFLTESDGGTGNKTIPQQQQHTYQPDFVCRAQGNEPELPGEVALSRVKWNYINPYRVVLESGAVSE